MENEKGTERKELEQNMVRVLDHLPDSEFFKIYGLLWTIDSVKMLGDMNRKDVENLRSENEELRKRLAEAENKPGTGRLLKVV